MAIVFTKGAIPTVTRQRKANPYVEDVKALAEDMTSSITAKDLPYTTEDDVKAVNAFINLMQGAGRELNVSVRKLVEVHETTEGTGKAAKVTKTADVTFWAVEAIKRPRSLD